MRPIVLVPSGKPQPFFTFMEADVRTTQLQAWFDRMRAGDPAARDELLRACGGRLERLARKMLRRFPGVRRWAQTGDVLQNAVLRLLRALEQVRPASTRELFGLAAEQMRKKKKGTGAFISHRGHPLIKTCLFPFLPPFSPSREVVQSHREALRVAGPCGCRCPSISPIPRFHLSRTAMSPSGLGREGFRAAISGIR